MDSKVETKAALTGLLIQQMDIPHWPIFYLAKPKDTWCSIENNVRKYSIKNKNKGQKNITKRSQNINTTSYFTMPKAYSLQIKKVSLLCGPLNIL